MEIHRNGERRRGPEEWFTGVVHLTPIATPADDSRLAIFDVVFEAGARTAWHWHPHGQVLHVTEGWGRVGRRNAPAEEIRPGDSVRIAPGEWHWHGAGPTTSMRHLAVQEAAENGTTAEWGEHVTDTDYQGRATLLRSRLTAAKRTESVEVRRIRLSPNEVPGAHVHNCPVVGSIEQGSVTFQREGEPSAVLGPGDVFYEPEAVTISRFDAGPDGLTFLAYFLLDGGQSPEIELVAKH
ncbi:(R)-mandelonitrile lyase [Fodinicola acaciae]|uniref:(R)-mandelonitrile lyase n=1 Tax=Fodinicola acaciae TaxID=2681555 RepID=UPI0013D302CF|nr:cupin domain-containing protein [Fodinicola acaciae]